MIKKREKSANAQGGALREMLCGDRVILRGEGGAVIHGCVRILHYGKELLCFATASRSVSLVGKSLVCTSFTAGSVTVSGVVDALCFCARGCNGKCQKIDEMGESV